jgi:hypothetical protein
MIKARVSEGVINMNEQEFKEYLINFVQEFGTKYNALEKSIDEKSKAETAAFPNFTSEQERVDWERKNLSKYTDWFEEFRKLYIPIFEKYCTDKKRTYGGPDNISFGFPVKFNGIENSIEINVTIKNKNRAEVYFKTSTSFDDEYLFVVLRKTDEWKIDGYKNRRCR